MNERIKCCFSKNSLKKGRKYSYNNDKINEMSKLSYNNLTETTINCN